MNESEQKAILSIALMAAFVDGKKEERERAQVKRVAQALGGAQLAIDVPAIYHDVLSKKTSLDDLARDLTTPEGKQFAYEMSVGVCDADGASSDAEREFLASLREKLGIEAGDAQSFLSSADNIANAPLPRSSVIEPTYTSSTSDVELDKMILNYSILNGALELLPQSLASMAIIPMQMKMVYRVGKAHGFNLDRGHISEFLATIGIGLTSQYIEQFGTKLVGGLLGKFGGGFAGKLGGGLGNKVGRQATSSAFSFASTYALGQLAKRYYASGRTLSSASLKGAYQTLLNDAKSLQDRYAGEIEAKSRMLDVKQILTAVRG